MTREEQIIEAAEKATYQNPPQYSELVHKSRKVMSAYEVGFIDGCVWADQHPHWISVDEELPPASCGVISDPVLVFIGNNKGWCGYIREGFYNHAAKEWSYMNRGRTHNVTHWMPIVPPRKEDKQ